MSVQVAKRLFTVDEYYKMAEVGIFDEDDRVELIHGEIIEMSPIGNLHMFCVNRLTGLLKKIPDEAGILSIQNPIGIDDYSEPEPDIAIFRYRSDYYKHQKPKPADVLLIIEVADTSLQKDRSVKIPLYAGAGIPEVWLVDLNRERLTVYTQPIDGSYMKTRHFLPGEMAFCSTIPAISWAVLDIFGLG